MSDEETTPTEDSGDAFASDAETVLEAAPAATDAASASEPTGNDAFSDANNDGGDEADGSAQGVSQGAPEEYGEFSLPEGFTADAEGMTVFQTEAKERGLSQEQAQSELGTLLLWKERMENSMQTKWTSDAGAWTQSSKAAGLMTPESRSLASVGLKALDHDGSAGQILRERGLDRHPAIVAAFKAYGAAISDDSRVPGVGSNGGTVTKSAAEILYPNQS